MNQTAPILDYRSDVTNDHTPANDRKTDSLAVLLSIGHRIASAAVIVTFLAIAMIMAGKDFWDLLPLALIFSVIGFVIGYSLWKFPERKLEGAAGLWGFCAINSAIVITLMILARTDHLAPLASAIYNKLIGT